jgi:TatD DNase family protein
MPSLFDAHSHLPNPDAPSPGQDQVICGTCEADWAAVLSHAAADAQVIPMLGLHPWFVAEASPNWAPHLEAQLRSHRAGVGECGLDFSRRNANRAAQITAFQLQLRLARDLHRPVAMHMVQAWGSLLDLLRAEGVPPAGALIHDFSGSPDMARTLQGLGIFLSFSGALLKPERQKLREALRATLPELLLLETDGASDLTHVLEVAAGIRGASLDDLAMQTWENGRRCFKELMA